VAPRLEHCTLESMGEPRRSETVGRVARRTEGDVVLPFGGQDRAVLALGARPELAEGAVVRVWGEGAAAEVELLAAPGTARAAVWGLVARHALRVAWPAAAWAEVDRALAAPGLSDPALEDLEGVPFCTIDNADSRDLDQALHVADDGAGGHVVRYALADAAYYVRAGGALFAESLLRGASFYLPGLSVPMLPRALSEGLVSLNPEVPRRALVFTMRLDAEGRAAGTRVARARIRSRAKLSYAGVQAFYDGAPGGAIADPELRESLERLRVVGERRQALARARDVVDYERIGVGVSIDDAGAFVLATDERMDVERHNEQLSLLCNIEGARLLAEAAGPRAGELQAVFRVHDAPSPERLSELEDAIDAIVAMHGLDRREFAWRRRGHGEREALADYLKRLPRAGRFARVREALERQVRLTNVRSLFAAHPGVHYALGVDGYARFSAPMREVAGIFTHKEALELLGLATSPEGAAADAATREAVIEAANRSKEVQSRLTKDAYKLAIDALLEADLRLDPAARPLRTGTVLGAAPSRVYLRLDAPAIELKVYAEDLEAAWGGPVELLQGGVGLGARAGAERLAAGDAVTLRTQRLDRDRDRWHFEVVGEH
jgi:ribonuclease R